MVLHISGLHTNEIRLYLFFYSLFYYFFLSIASLRACVGTPPLFCGLYIPLLVYAFSSQWVFVLSLFFFSYSQCCCKDSHVSPLRSQHQTKTPNCLQGDCTTLHPTHPDLDPHQRIVMLDLNVCQLSWSNLPHDYFSFYYHDYNKV